MEALRPACPTVRHAAVLQLRDEHLPQLLETLDDMSDRVAEAAVLRLGEQPWSSLKPALEDKLGQQWHALRPSRREAIFQLLPKWQQLAFLLARLDAEPEVQVFWLRQLTLWCDCQSLMVDPVTPKIEREAIRDKLGQPVGLGLLRSNDFQRVIG